MWKPGEAFIEKKVPEFGVGEYARYHHLSFSWLVGGIILRIVNGSANSSQKSVSEVCIVCIYMYIDMYVCNARSFSNVLSLFVNPI